MTASKILLSLAETVCNSFVQKTCLMVLIKLSSLVCKKSDVRTRKTISLDKSHVYLSTANLSLTFFRLLI